MRGSSPRVTALQRRPDGVDKAHVDDLVVLDVALEDAGLAHHSARGGPGLPADGAVAAPHLVLEGAVEGGAQIASTTAGPGKGGAVQVAAQGSLRLTDPGSGVLASAGSTASGDAGSVTVSAQQIAITKGAEISSTKFPAVVASNGTVKNPEFTKLL